MDCKLQSIGSYRSVVDAQVVARHDVLHLKTQILIHLYQSIKWTRPYRDECHPGTVLEAVLAEEPHVEEVRVARVGQESRDVAVVVGVDQDLPVVLNSHAVIICEMPTGGVVSGRDQPS